MSGRYGILLLVCHQWCSVCGKKSYLEDVKVKELIEKIEEMFKGEGRVVIRASGTEPLIRVMIEGKDQKVIDEKANEIAKAISNM